MFESEPLRQRPDRRRLPLRQPANHQQKEILLRLQPRSARRVIAFAQKLPNLVPQFRQRPILLRPDLAAHRTSISYCDTLRRPAPPPVRNNQRSCRGGACSARLLRLAAKPSRSPIRSAAPPGRRLFGLPPSKPSTEQSQSDQRRNPTPIDKPLHSRYNVSQ
jgi:hypothetical protein